MLKTRVLNRTPEYPASSLHRWQTGNRRGPRTGGKRATRVHVRRQRSRAAADRAAFTGDDLDEGRSRLTRLAQVWGRCAWGRWTLSGWTARRVGRGRCGRSRSTSPSRSCMPSRSGISPLRHTTEPAHSAEAGSVRHALAGELALASPQPESPSIRTNTSSSRVHAEMLVTQAYRYALDPTPRQQRALTSHWGAARYAYNSGLDALARGLASWSDSKAGRRKGRRVGFPRRKTRHRARPACRFTTGAIRVEPDRHHVVLPRIGRIRTHESTRKLARRLEKGTARILSATVTCTADRWFVSFTVEVQRRVPESRGVGVVGVDVGVRHLAVLSTGQVIANPRPLDRAQQRLRRLNRQLARRQGSAAPDGTRRAPSAGWRHAKQRLARAHARVVHLRRDVLHKLTTDLTPTYGTVVVEHLNVAGMLRNRHLAPQLADSGFGELRRQLAYKTAWAGGVLVQATTFYPSSKTCSGCGHVKAKLPLSERAYRCEQCGLVMDRDLNAARNLAQMVAGGEAVEPGPHMVGAVAGSGPETRNARGVDVRPGLAGQTATNREAGTGCCPDQTGTGGAQAPAAQVTDTR